MSTIEGTVERVTFHHPEIGCSVVRLKPEHVNDLITVVGANVTLTQEAATT